MSGRSGKGAQLFQQADAVLRALAVDVLEAPVRQSLQQGAVLQEQLPLLLTQPGIPADLVRNFSLALFRRALFWCLAQLLHGQLDELADRVVQELLPIFHRPHLLETTLPHFPGESDSQDQQKRGPIFDHGGRSGPGVWGAGVRPAAHCRPPGGESPPAPPPGPGWRPPGRRPSAGAAGWCCRPPRRVKYIHPSIVLSYRGVLFIYSINLLYIFFRKECD